MPTKREVVDGWSRGVSGTDVRADRLVHVEHVWGTAVTLNVPAAGSRAEAALSAIEMCTDMFAEVDGTFSTYRPQTEVSLYRSGLDRSGHQSMEFEEVLEACRELRAVTCGAFDPWSVPGGYDPSGYVKGWAAGRASAMLLAAGCADHLVNAGGDICAHGDEVEGSGLGWPVGIVNPHRPSEIIEVVTLRDSSMATSGRYERGDHLIDPTTGLPATGIDSATVVGPDPGVADALASAAYVQGPASIEWFESLGQQWSLHLVSGEVVRTFGPAFEGGSGPG
ncbi:unannotated protein [freshwater metagenome]|uniref:FAD:protein FMN transferase n=1 Tax=freshwater metagenome TaxID=449393 RepID=A0A6J7M432_9ZZZZ